MAAPTTTMRALDRDLELRRPPRSLWSDAWRRFRKNRLAIAGLAYILFLAIVAIAAPVIAPHNPVQSDVQHAGVFRQAAWIHDPNPMRTGTWEYPLGTDSVGRDVFSRLVYGTRVSLVVGFVPMVFTVSIGMLVGLLAGYAGGRVDNLLMRFTDVVYAFPDLLLFIIMQVAFQDAWIGKLLNGLVLLFITLSLVSWVTVARLVRGEVLALKQKEFVEAARAIGASGASIVARHIVPNTLGPIIVVAAYIVPGAIISEAILSYLGIGIRPTVQLDAPFPTSWGSMILEGSKAWESQPWMLIAPTLAVASITLAFTFVGDGLRDAFDPRQAER
ncbi:ABC transporter permease [Thermomicrobium sp. CFH 73360]|uniref:ABC transporter permease n=1 Tax=Thermomicrobium sp. CFH 73360 TaxID=2951987 RepID=UPI002076BC31|nr:ABC transporter permease [Thermomicrobium sp. CFH 73360]MCM8745591.1 ABC transporter permease [Thermomicrobium sp. CFH 73360]